MVIKGQISTEITQGLPEVWLGDVKLTKGVCELHLKVWNGSCQTS